MRYKMHKIDTGKLLKDNYLNEFLIKVQDIPEHPNYPKHTHEFNELVIVYEGTGVNCINEYEYAINAGDVFVIHAEERHAYKKSNHLHLSNILFDPTLTKVKGIDMNHMVGFHALFKPDSEAKSTRTRSCLHLNNTQLNKARAIIEQLEHEVDNKKPGYRAISQSLLLLLIGKLSRWYDAPRYYDPLKLEKISKSISYMEQRLYEPICIKKLAELAKMSERNFFRIFNKATCMTPNQYLLNLRLTQAANLLTYSNMPITEIAFECGFQDSSYLSKVFRKHYNKSPREYRYIKQN